jgi:hypothetical protein
VADQDAGADRQVDRLLEVGVISVPSIPRYVCLAWPFVMSCRAIWLTLSIGIAKPMPMLPAFGSLFPVRIWLVIPITRPNRSISGYRPSCRG